MVGKVDKQVARVMIMIDDQEHRGDILRSALCRGIEQQMESLFLDAGAMTISWTIKHDRDQERVWLFERLDLLQRSLEKGKIKRGDYDKEVRDLLDSSSIEVYILTLWIKYIEVPHPVDPGWSLFDAGRPGEEQCYSVD